MTELKQLIEKQNAMLQEEGKKKIVVGVVFAGGFFLLLFMVITLLLVYVRISPGLGLAISVGFNIALFAVGCLIARRGESPLERAISGIGSSRRTKFDAANSYRLGFMFRLLTGTGPAVVATLISAGQRKFLEGSHQRRLLFATDRGSIVRAEEFLASLQEKAMPLDRATKHPDFFLLRGLFLIREQPAGPGKFSVGLTQRGQEVVRSANR